MAAVSATLPSSSSSNNSASPGGQQQPQLSSKESLASPPVLGNQGNKIKVICRFRPQNSIETSHGGSPIVSIDDDSVSCRVESRDYPGQFNFDRIFDWNSKQHDIFECCGIPLIEQCFDGFNSTLFCYGQTGSGKTHTMMGPSVEDAENKGMIPRLVEKIFETIGRAPSTVEFTVQSSFLEIYMERIRDLLNPANDNLPIHEDRNRGIYVKGLKEVYVSSVPEVYEVIKSGNEIRSVAATNMNEQSSRSHSIFIITISQKDITTGNVKSGKLYLVDLAGSEKVGKTGATGQALEEAKKINKSLTALGIVINSLTDGKSTHIPYRDSKLTRMLQESLGGNSKTTLIINCSPSSYNDAETISTLRFGTRAKSITNRAVMNVELSATELKVLLKKSNTELSILQGYLLALEEEVRIWRTGGTVEKDKFVLKERFIGITSPNARTPSALSPVEDATLQPSVVNNKDTAIGKSLLPDDEREEFLNRENELTDQLAAKENELQSARGLLSSAQAELSECRAREQKLLADNNDLLKSTATLRVEMERLTLENKDAAILIETLRDSNLGIQSQLSELKGQFQEFQLKSPLSPTSNTDKEKMKSEKTAQMLREMGVDSLNSKEAEIRATLDALNSSTSARAMVSQNETAQQLQEKLQFAQKETAHLEKLNAGLTSKCRELEEELAELYDKAIADEEKKEAVEKAADTIQDLKSKIETQFNEKRAQLEKQMTTQQTTIEQRDAEIDSMKKEILHLQTALENFASSGGLSLADEDTMKLKQMMTRQMEEFEQIKKSLMKDLQDRCEKVVELEIALDDLHEQHENLLQKQNARAEQKKMAFLEQNLEQLTKLQKQLVEQNVILKRNVDTLEKKILNRNDRITDLEKILIELNVKYSQLQEMHETEIHDLRKKVAEGNVQPSTSNFTFGNGRIAKPLRGGQENPDDSGSDLDN